GNRHAEFQRRCAIAEITSQGNRRPATDTEPFKHGDSGRAHGFQAGNGTVDTALISDALLAIESGELLDIRTGNKGFATNTMKHNRIHYRVVIYLLAYLFQLVVHMPRHGVAALWTVVADPGQGLTDMAVNAALVLIGHSLSPFGSVLPALAAER